jgi:hypothetical protein
MASSPRSPSVESSAGAIVRNGRASVAPSLTIQIMPPRSTTNRRDASLGGAARWIGDVNDPTGCRLRPARSPAPAGGR